MTCYKIIKNKKIIDAGHVFLKWSEKYQQMFVCKVDQAQFVQSSDEKYIYTADWLIPPPREAGNYESVEVSIIDEEEYNNLKEQLDIDKEIEIPEEPKETIIVPPEPTPAEPMSAAEMRQTILTQQEQISMLTECILELSEMVYGEEVES